MSLILLNGKMPRQAVLTSGAIPAVPAVQDQVMGAHMNSLFDHSRPWQSVPPWMDRMCDADGGKTFAAQGTYSWENNDPPNWNQNWTPDAATPGATASWPSVDAANFTAVLLGTDNFSGPPIGPGDPTDPSVGGEIARPPGPYPLLYPGHIDEVIAGMEANTNDEPIYWIYEGWADAGSILDEFTGAGTAQEFADWRALTTTTYGYGLWFDNLLTLAKASNPTLASRIKLIPVARVMVSVMELPALAGLNSDDWFEDNAPHGTDTCYLLVSMICYAAIYQEQPPLPVFTGANINATFAGIYNDIAAHVFSEVSP